MKYIIALLFFTLSYSAYAYPYFDIPSGYTGYGGCGTSNFNNCQAQYNGGCIRVTQMSNSSCQNYDNERTYRPLAGSTNTSCGGIPGSTYEPQTNVTATNYITQSCVLPVLATDEECANNGATCLISSSEEGLCIAGSYFEGGANVGNQRIYSKNGTCDASNEAILDLDNTLVYDDFTGLEHSTLDPSSSCLDDTSGKQVCIQDGLITSYDGWLTDSNFLNQQTEENTQCGVNYGGFNCVKTGVGNSGCGKFNGQLICFKLDGTPLDANDPDNPLNGGNRDGNSTNDSLAVGDTPLAAPSRAQNAANAVANSALGRAVASAIGGNDESEGTEEEAEELTNYETMARGDKDYFDEEGLASDLQSAQDEIDQLYVDLKSMVSGTFSMNDAVGNLPCMGSINYQNGSAGVCLNQYQSELSQIPTAILLLSYFLAGIIILRS